MKNKMLLFVFTLMLLFLYQPLSLLANRTQEGKDVQEKEHEPIVEEITVTNIEVPVRVLNKGKPVTNLTKDDFTLYEDKKKMEINAFFLKQKKLQVTKTKEIIETPKSSPAPRTSRTSRTFVLSFSITDFNEHLQKAVDHLFAKILTPDDRLLVFANDKTREYPHLREKDAIRQQLHTVLKEESEKARHKLVNYVSQIEAYVRVSDLRRDMENSPKEKPSLKVFNFLKKYQRTWNDYKKRFLTPNVDRFYFFSRYLEKIKGEKWVLNFYQLELFPNIRLTSEVANYIRTVAIALYESRDPGDQSIGKMINILLDELNKDMIVSKTFPTGEVAKLFYKVDATFHSFFIRTMKKGETNDLDYVEVSSDIEKTLKQITDVTGGKNIASNDLVQSLETVSELEDSYYILSYVPQDPGKAGKLKIKVKGKGYKVLYDDNFNADWINDYVKKIEAQVQQPDIKIEDFSFQGKVLAFTVKNYLMRPVENNNIGRMKIRISLTNLDNNSKVFDQEKVLTAQKEEMKISLGAFKSIKKGQYNFIIDAVDLFTGKGDNLHQQIRVK